MRAHVHMHVHMHTCLDQIEPDDAALQAAEVSGAVRGGIREARQIETLDDHVLLPPLLRCQRDAVVVCWHRRAVGGALDRGSHAGAPREEKLALVEAQELVGDGAGAITDAEDVRVEQHNAREVVGQVREQVELGRRRREIVMAQEREDAAVVGRPRIVGRTLHQLAGPARQPRVDRLRVRHHKDGNGLGAVVMLKGLVDEAALGDEQIERVHDEGQIPRPDRRCGTARVAPCDDTSACLDAHVDASPVRRRHRISRLAKRAHQLACTCPHRDDPDRREDCDVLYSSRLPHLTFARMNELSADVVFDVGHIGTGPVPAPAPAPGPVPPVPAGYYRWQCLCQKEARSFFEQVRLGGTARQVHLKVMQS